MHNQVNGKGGIANHFVNTYILQLLTNIYVKHASLIQSLKAQTQVNHGQFRAVAENIFLNSINLFS